ncbi:Kae1-like domain-containing protein, partial [Kaarinaea lacus]
PGRWQRLASQTPFYLPGGDKAGRDAWRSALALCWQTDRPWPKHLNKSGGDMALLQQAWRSKLNCPQTSAVGRLFDAAAALLRVCNQYSFEGQGPMLLETLADRSENAPSVDMPLTKDEDGIWRCDWQPLLDLLLDEDHTPADRAAGFHLSMAMSVLRQVKHFHHLYGDFAVGLSGGVFQNRLLTETVFALLRQEGYRVYLPQRLPANDGGVCFGQVIEALHKADV